MSIVSTHAATPGPRRVDARLEAAMIFAGWTVIGLLFASTTFFRARIFGEPITIEHTVSITAADVYSWAAIMTIAFHLTRRAPLVRGRWPRSLLVLTVVGLVLIVARAMGLHAFLQSTGQYPDRTWAQSVYSIAPSNFVTYWMVVGVAHAAEFARRFRERELSTAQLETQLARAQLQMLKMQLHPHFLFNTLHAISTLVHRDPEAAERMIASLSELLRATLTHQQAQEVTVREEMDLLETYLDIEKTRLAERLNVRIAVDAGAREAKVPHLILQPLVENAIRHGIAPRRHGGSVEISVARAGERLHLEVRDDGLGFERGAVVARRRGVGLSNTRARLDQLYPGDHRFTVASTPGSGTRVEIGIPFRVADPARELAAAW